MARRILSAALTVAAVAAGLAIVDGTPAQAVEWSKAPMVSRAYTDVRSPHEIFVDRPGPTPVGAWRDEQGHYHSSRSYFTYDLSGYRGMLIKGAQFYSEEVTVTDCARPVVVELWLTDDVTGSSSWLKPPAQRKLVHAGNRGAPGPCPTGFGVDLIEIVKRTLDAGRDRITLGLRIDGLKEFDPRLGRRLRANSFLSIAANTRPTVPVELAPCDTSTSNTDIVFRARSEDPDYGDHLNATVAVWPEHDPAQRQEFTGGFEMPEGTIQLTWRDHGFPDGRYTWSIRSTDREDLSEWSAPCTFTIDRVAPAAPSVSSVDYPSDGQTHGGAGVPGRFTFTGPPDAVAYRYGLSGASDEVRAAAPGEPVTVEIAPPGGPKWLDVEAIDAAGNRSAVTRYQFWVRSTEPGVRIGPVRGVGFPVQVTFSPGVEGIVEYGYRVNDGPETRLPAGPDGTATVTVTLPHPGFPVLHVRSWTAAGLAGVRHASVLVVDEPEVSWDGAALELRPRRAATAHYRYTLNNGDPVQVAADSTGAATVPLDLPDGRYEVRVVSVDAGGAVSGATLLQFTIRSAAPGPAVSSDVYGNSPEPAGGVGVPGTFSFTTGAAFFEVESFMLVLNGGPETSVWADFDGSGRAVLAPDRSGTNTLTVRARYYDGTMSRPTTFTFEVADVS